MGVNGMHRLILEFADKTANKAYVETWFSRHKPYGNFVGFKVEIWRTENGVEKPEFVRSALRNASPGEPERATLLTADRQPT